MKIAVLASGRGSNLKAIIDKYQQNYFNNVTLELVISNKPDAYALEHAKNAGIDTKVFLPKDYDNRGLYDSAIVNKLIKRDIDFVVLAGYMRIVSPIFIQAFKHRIINIHPALLPAFPGLHAQKQALDYGVKVSGCTVHFVDEGMDTGPIIMQQTVEVKDDDTEDILSERILKEEHQLFSLALRKVTEEKFQVNGRRVKFG